MTIQGPATSVFRELVISQGSARIIPSKEKANCKTQVSKRKKLLINTLKVMPKIVRSVYILYDAFSALAGVTQWIECQPAKQRVTSSIPSPGIHLG